MSLNHPTLEFKPAPKAPAGQAQLDALLRETFVMRCQLDNPRNECRRELLATRLDATDARTADIAARLLEAGAGLKSRSSARSVAMLRQRSRRPASHISASTFVSAMATARSGSPPWPSTRTQSTRRTRW
jgi:hypothetical protein